MDWAFGLSWWLVSTIAIFVGGAIAIFIGFGGAIGNAIEGTVEVGGRGSAKGDPLLPPRVMKI